jgi:hypothetical protein
MFSVAYIRDDSNCFFLFYFKFLKGSLIGTTIYIDTIYYVRVDHGII